MLGYRPPLAALAAAALSLSLGAATAAPFDGPPAGKIEERIGTAAVGEPRPFTARVSAICEASQCIADFGRKGNRTRTIALVNCGFLGRDGAMVQASVLLDGSQGVFIPVVSRSVEGDFESAITNWTTPFTVPPGVRLQIQLNTWGTASLSVCNIQGTIEAPVAP